MDLRVDLRRFACELSLDFRVKDSRCADSRVDLVEKERVESENELYTIRNLSWPPLYAVMTFVAVRNSKPALVLAVRSLRICPGPVR